MLCVVGIEHAAIHEGIVLLRKNQAVAQHRGAADVLRLPALQKRDNHDRIVIGVADIAIIEHISRHEALHQPYGLTGILFVNHRVEEGVGLVERKRRGLRSGLHANERKRCEQQGAGSHYLKSRSVRILS